MTLLSLAVVVATVGSACRDTKDSGCKPTRTVEIFGPWSGDEQTDFQRVLDKFEQSSGIDVRYTSTGRDIAGTLETELRSRNPPDVAILPQPGLLRELAHEDRLLSIDGLKDDVTENFAADWVELGKNDGTLYGVWFKANNKSTIWFDKKAFADARVDPLGLTTWASLLAEADRLATSGKPPFSIAGGETDAWVLTDWFENVYLRTAGAENYRKLTDHRIPWTDPSVQTALGALAQLFNRPRLLAGGPEGVLATGYPDSVHQVFETPPKAAMVFEADFLTAFIPRAAMPNAEFFDFPGFPGVTEQSVIVGGNVAVLPKPGPDQQENCGAREFVRALTKAETVEPWAITGAGFSSANGSLAPKLPSEPAKRAAFEMQTRPILFDLSDQQPLTFGGTPGKGMYGILRDFVRDPSNPAATARLLEEAWRTAR